MYSGARPASETAAVFDLKKTRNHGKALLDVKSTTIRCVLLRTADEMLRGGQDPRHLDTSIWVVEISRIGSRFISDYAMFVEVCIRTESDWASTAGCQNVKKCKSSRTAQLLEDRAVIPTCTHSPHLVVAVCEADASTAMF